MRSHESELSKHCTEIGFMLMGPCVTVDLIPLQKCTYYILTITYFSIHQYWIVASLIAIISILFFLLQILWEYEGDSSFSPSHSINEDRQSYRQANSQPITDRQYNTQTVPDRQSYRQANTPAITDRQYNTQTVLDRQSYRQANNQAIPDKQYNTHTVLDRQQAAQTVLDTPATLYTGLDRQYCGKQYMIRTGLPRQMRPDSYYAPPGSLRKEYRPMCGENRRYVVAPGARERQYAIPSQHGRQYIVPAASNSQFAVLGNPYGSGVRRSMLCPPSASSEKHYESLLDKEYGSVAKKTSGGKQYMTAAVMEKQYLAAAVLDWSLRYPPRSPPTSEETFTGTENRHVPYSAFY
jgi:hypothetical protein